MTRPGEAPRHGLGSCDRRSSARAGRGDTVYAAQCETRPGVRCDTTWCALPHDRPGLRHDQPQATTRRRVRAAWAQCARPVRAAWVQGVHLVHPTQFWTQCTVSVTVWTTVHEHCSHDFSKKKIIIIIYIYIYIYNKIK